MAASNTENAHKPFVAQGQIVVSESGYGVRDLRVVIFEVRHRIKSSHLHSLGSSTTCRDGRFRILLDGTIVAKLASNKVFLSVFPRFRSTVKDDPIFTTDHFIIRNGQTESFPISLCEKDLESFGIDYPLGVSALQIAADQLVRRSDAVRFLSKPNEKKLTAARNRMRMRKKILDNFMPFEKAQRGEEVKGSPDFAIGLEEAKKLRIADAHETFASVGPIRFRFTGDRGLFSPQSEVTVADLMKTVSRQVPADVERGEPSLRTSDALKRLAEALKTHSAKTGNSRA